MDTSEADANIYTHISFVIFVPPARPRIVHGRRLPAARLKFLVALWSRFEKDMATSIDRKKMAIIGLFPFFLFFSDPPDERESGRVWTSDLSVILFVDLLLFFLIFLDFRLFASVHASASLGRRQPRRIDRKYASWCLVRLYHASSISYIHTHRIIYRRYIALCALGRPSLYLCVYNSIRLVIDNEINRLRRQL